MTALKPLPRLVKDVVENRLNEWRRLLRSSTTQARTVLQRVLKGRLTFTPHVDRKTGEVDGYDFSGPTRFDRLFVGVAAPTPAWVNVRDRTGFEDDDADYGRLLARAANRPNRVEVLASPGECM